MAFLFGYDEKLAGCFTRLNIDSSHGIGAYIEFTGTQYPMPSNGTDPAIVTDVAFAQREKFYLVDCFNDNLYVYAFGRDASSSLISVTTLGFMSNKGVDFGVPMKDALGLYNTNRLSRNPTPLKIHIGVVIVEGVLVGVRSNVQDLTHQLQNITYEFLALDVLGATT